MAIVVVGLNYKTATVAVRERLAFADPTLAEPLAQFQHPVVEEVVILSTCNRVEIDLHTRDPESGVNGCIDFLATFHKFHDNLGTACPSAGATLRSQGTHFRSTDATWPWGSSSTRGER